MKFPKVSNAACAASAAAILVAAAVLASGASASVVRFDGGPTVSGAAPVAHAAAESAGYRWRARRIPYYSAVRGSRWAVRTAVRSWNRSGARVRFVAVPRRRAKVTIRYLDAPRCVGEAFAMVEQRRGVARSAEVYVSRPDPSNAACTRWAHALTVAHELGHVMGLDHETERCALMNSQLLNFAPYFCPPTRGWEWRCRILEPDDVRGAVHLYGGSVRPVGSPVCPTFAPPAEPGEPLAAPAVEGAVDARFERPATVVPPTYLLDDEEGFAFATALDRCPDLVEARPHDWSVPVGGVQPTSFWPDRPGRYCIAAWTIDAAGRTSGASTAWIDVSFSPRGEPLVTAGS